MAADSAAHYHALTCRRVRIRQTGSASGAFSESLRVRKPKKYGSRFPALSAARTWPYREIRNDIERLWHDAAMHKARVFLGLERKLLDLSLVILGIFWSF